ncbi:MAG: peptidylprolyl isomerase [Actinobacteria bacterium]|nr:peptidylprolyl isomerase [Actinomycetota bacterium]
MKSRATVGRWLPLAAVLVLAACGGSSKSSSAPGTTTDATGCSTVAAPASAARTESKPKAALDPSKTYAVTMATNCGVFTIKLAVKTSPATSASFVNLVRKGFFDHTVFHRIVPGFIIQGGDPTASGEGGPGYTTVDAPPASTRYTLGIVAMAKTQTEPSGTSGSQFFVVTAQDAQLPPQYAVLGTVTSGLPVIDRIGKLGDPSTEQPTEVVEIQKATVTAK